MQIDERSPGKVPGVVLASPAVVIGEVEADVARHRSFDVIGAVEDAEEFGGGDQRHAMTVPGPNIPVRRALASTVRPTQDRHMSETRDTGRTPESDRAMRFRATPEDDREVDEERTDEGDDVLDLLPEELQLPLETPEADALEQIREVPVDDDLG